MQWISHNKILMIQQIPMIHCWNNCMILIPLIFINNLRNNPRISVHTASKGGCSKQLNQNQDGCYNLRVYLQDKYFVSDEDGRYFNNGKSEKKRIHRWTIFDIELLTHKGKYESAFYSMSSDESYLSLALGFISN